MPRRRSIWCRKVSSRRMARWVGSTRRELARVAQPHRAEQMPRWARRRRVRAILARVLPVEAAAAKVADDRSGPRQRRSSGIRWPVRWPRSMPWPASLREPLILCAVEGLSQAEAAEALGLSGRRSSCVSAAPVPPCASRRGEGPGEGRAAPMRIRGKIDQTTAMRRRDLWPGASA